MAEKKRHYQLIVVLVIIVVFMLLLLLEKPRQYLDQTAGKAIFPGLHECNDHVDNDGDGKTDYPTDPQCTSPTDDSEKS